jgi:hypothetical protein
VVEHIPEEKRVAIRPLATRTVPWTDEEQADWQRNNPPKMTRDEEIAAKNLRTKNIKNIFSALYGFTGNRRSPLEWCYRVELVMKEDVEFQWDWLATLVKFGKLSDVRLCGIHTPRDSDIDGDGNGDHPSMGTTRIHIDLYEGCEGYKDADDEHGIEYRAESAKIERFLNLLSYDVGDRDGAKVFVKDGRWVVARTKTQPRVISRVK